MVYLDGKKTKGKDYTDKRFGRLVGIRPIKRHDKSRCIVWLWQCDCGETVERIIHHITRTHYSSCGCYVKELNHNRWAGIEGESNFTLLYHSYKRGAANRCLTFQLSRDRFRELTKQRCFYCNVLPRTERNDANTYGKYIYNGIDRVDNDKGYSVDNCVTCCETCNRAKRSMSIQTFNDWIKRIYLCLYEPHIQPFTVTRVK